MLLYGNHDYFVQMHHSYQFIDGGSSSLNIFSHFITLSNTHKDFTIPNVHKKGNVYD